MPAVLALLATTASAQALPSPERPLSPDRPVAAFSDERSAWRDLVVDPRAADGVPSPAGRSMAFRPAGPPQPLQAAGDDPTAAARDLTQLATQIENAATGPQDLAHARALYCSAARADYPDALIRLGYLYADGRSVKRNDDIARTLFVRAAQLGSQRAASLAQAIPVGRELMPACLRTGLDVAVEEEDVPPPKLAGAAADAELPAPLPEAVPTPGRKKLLEMVTRMARQFMLDPRLVFAVIQAESGFDPNARSNKNAQGLMQLIPETAERFAVHNVLDPAENLRGGMMYLRWLLSYFRGDVVLALAAYNAGEGAVDRFKGVPPFAETMAYVQRIRSIYPLDRHPYDPNAATPSALVTRRPPLRNVSASR